MALRDSDIHHYRALLLGRRVTRIEHPWIRDSDDPDHGSFATFLQLSLDNGVRVLLLDGDGFPPLLEKEPTFPEVTC